MARTITPVAARVERELRDASAHVAARQAGVDAAIARRDDTIARAYAQGVPIKRIAELADVTRMTVYARLRAAGVLVDTG